ncbi:helix-turn-helix domain-containing protein [Fictibacillus phosphorivorans]|uniref:helix-turn-helix domain-containing protein n=1 Tax=Fictibacillus phosphorivorans TaxID=1221500 RepID=UPI003CFB328A
MENKRLTTMELTAYDLRILRHALGYTQRQVGFLIEKSEAYVGHLETQKRPMTRKIQGDLIKAFNLNEDVHMQVRLLSESLKLAEGK